MDFKRTLDIGTVLLHLLGLVTGFFTIFSSFAAEPERITIAHGEFKPFIWSEMGESKGIYVDITKEVVAKRMGLEVEFQHFPWPRAQSRVKHGKSDGFITLVTTERLLYTVVGVEPLVASEMGGFARFDHPQIDKMMYFRNKIQLKPFRLLTYYGDGDAAQRFKGYDMDFGASNLYYAIQKLLQRRGGVLIQTSEVTQYNLKELGLKEQIIQLPSLDLGKLNYKLMISKKSPFVGRINEIDQLLRELKLNGDLDKFKECYR